MIDSIEIFELRFIISKILKFKNETITNVMKKNDVNIWKKRKKCNKKRETKSNWKKNK